MDLSAFRGFASGLLIGLLPQGRSGFKLLGHELFHGCDASPPAREEWI